MNDQPPDLPAEATAASSLGSRLFNIIAAPGEVMDELHTSRESATNWVVPAVILILVSWVASTVLFSQPWVTQQITEVQQAAMETQLAKQGKTPAEIEQAKEASAKVLSLIPRIMAYAAPPFMAFGSCLLWGLIVWIIGAKICKAGFSFHKAVEITGITLVVDSLGGLVKTLLILVTGNVMASASPAMLLKPFDPANPLHSALSQIELFTLWGLALIALGLARLSGRTVATSAAWIFGTWIAIRGGLLALGQLVQMLTSK